MVVSYYAHAYMEPTENPDCSTPVRRTVREGTKRGTRTATSWTTDYDDDVRGTIRLGGGCYTDRAGWGCVEGARCGYWEYDGDADVATSSSSSGSGTSYQGGTCVDEDTCGDDGTGSYDDYTLECSAVLLKISAAAMLGYNMM